MEMATSLADLNNNNDNNNSEIDELIKDVEKNLDDKKNVSQNNYLPLNIDETEDIVLEENNNNDNNDNDKKKKKKVEEKYIINVNILNNFLILILFLIVNHPILNNYLDKLIKIDNFYYKYIIKGVIFVFLINLLKII